jgi:hypothetical protein
MIPSGTSVYVYYCAAGLLIPDGVIHPVVSVSVYYFAAGLLVPGGIIRPVASVSVYYFAAGLLVPGDILTTGRMIPPGPNSPAEK